MLIVVYRWARDPLKPNNTLGYNCAVCGEALQVSPTALDAIRAGGRSLCNTCGVKLVNETPVEELAGVGFSPQALEQINERIAKARKAKGN